MKGLAALARHWTAALLALGVPGAWSGVTSVAPRVLAHQAAARPDAMHAEVVSAASSGARPANGRAASPQASGGIRGRLDIRRVARPAERRPEVADPGAAALRDLPDLRRGVVYLESAPRSAFDERDPGRATMDQYKERFVPHVLAVMVGTVVDFPNSDRTYHNVFSLSKAKRFDLGRYAAGRSKSVRMDRPGVVRVFCDIHSHMSAFVLVFNHPFFNVTNPDGRFELPSVPPGTYTVVGWYEGEPRVTRSVVVPPSGWAEADLVVP
jgi:plastocyanin